MVINIFSSDTRITKNKKACRIIDEKECDVKENHVYIL